MDREDCAEPTAVPVAYRVGWLLRRTAASALYRLAR
jgi:hypothetical protein